MTSSFRKLASCISFRVPQVAPPFQDGHNVIDGRRLSHRRKSFSYVLNKHVGAVAVLSVEQGRPQSAIFMQILSVNREEVCPGKNFQRRSFIVVEHPVYMLLFVLTMTGLPTCPSQSFLACDIEFKGKIISQAAPGPHLQRWPSKAMKTKLAVPLSAC